jgi:hypothetical protein
MKQTAVEWLVEQIIKEKGLVDLDIQAAKEMEKEQMIDFTMDFMCKDNSYESYRRASALDLFNKTFNNNG